MSNSNTQGQSQSQSLSEMMALHAPVIAVPTDTPTQRKPVYIFAHWFSGVVACMSVSTLTC
jgi:hypothetical protein